MAYDKIWNNIHENMIWGKYPSEEVVRHFLGKYKHIPFKDRKKIKIIELGCGQSNNLWFLSREGFDTYGIEGSLEACKKGRDRLESENLDVNIYHGDFNDLSGFKKNYFDDVLDNVSLQHNRKSEIKNILLQAKNILKEDGKIFSVMVSDKTDGYKTGDFVEPGVYQNIQELWFKNRGLTCFSSFEDIIDYFQPFKDIVVDKKINIENGKTLEHYIIHN